MRSLTNKIGNYLTMGVMLVILSPLLISGLTLRYVDCHCDEMAGVCSLPTEPHDDGGLPPCCREDNTEMPGDHACQDNCCIKELHIESLDLDYQHVRLSSLDSDLELPQIDFPTGSIHSASGLLCVSDKSPPTSNYGRTLLIKLHQLKISSPIQSIA